MIERTKHFYQSNEWILISEEKFFCFFTRRQSNVLFSFSVKVIFHQFKPCHLDRSNKRTATFRCVSRLIRHIVSIKVHFRQVHSTQLIPASRRLFQPLCARNGFAVSVSSQQIDYFAIKAN